MGLNYVESFFYDFLVISLALKVNFFIVGKSGGRTGYPCLCISLSTFLLLPFIGRLRGASIAMRVGERVSERSKICLFSCKWQVEITLFFHRVHPVGLVSGPVKSIPIMIFFVNPDIVHLSFNNRLLFR